MDAQLCPFHSRQIEFLIVRRVVDRIAADDNEQLDLTAVEISDESPERLPMIDRIHFQRIRVEHRLANIAELAIQRMNERVNLRRLALTGEDDACAPVLFEILYQSLNPRIPGQPLPRIRKIGR